MFIYLAVLVFAHSAGSNVSAESYSAYTMRLLRYEGNVEIQNEAGESRFVMENVRFESGEAMSTGEESLASVGLDEGRIVTVDEESKVKFDQNGDEMELSLSEGQMLLDVENHLDENERLDIQTSTMMVGIRGTIVLAADYETGHPNLPDILSESGENMSSAGTAGRVSLVSLLEGQAECTYTDGTGNPRSFMLSAGQKAVILDADMNGLADSEPMISAVTAEDLRGFVSEQAAENTPLTERISAGTGIPSSDFLPQQSGYDAPVRLIAQSASRIYDGTPLTRTDDVLCYGLPEGFVCEATAGGSLTDAGMAANPVSDYKIYNDAGEDVTDLFTNVTTTDGVLVVDPAPAVVWTGSASKVYDGTPLTNPDARLITAPGYQAGQEPWSNLSYAVAGAESGQALYGVTGSVLVHGTNPLTGETQEIELYAGKNLSVFLHNEGEERTIEFRMQTISEDEIPEEILRLFADNEALLKKSAENAMWDVTAIRNRIAALSDTGDGRVNKLDLLVAEEASDDLYADYTNVRIKIDTDITDYNDRPLYDPEAVYSQVSPAAAKVTATGSQTEVGESINTYAIDWGSANSGNYTIREDLGMLKVLPRERAVTPVPTVTPVPFPTVTPIPVPTYDTPVVFAAASAEKVFDGTSLMTDSVSVSGLPAGYTCSTAATGSQTNAGSSANAVSFYRIYDPYGADVTDRFTDIRFVSGTLTVSPLQITMDLGGAVSEYNGQKVSPQISAVYGNGAHAGEYVEGGATKAASSPTVLTFFTGDRAQVTASGGGTGAGTYTLAAETTFLSGLSSNYSIFVSGQTFTVQPKEAIVTTGSATKVYDRRPLTCTEASIEGLVPGETALVTATGTITEVGTAVNTYAIDWGSTDSANYTLTENLGTLTVTSPGAPTPTPTPTPSPTPAYDAPVIFTAKTDSKEYDGTPLTAPEVTAEGLPKGFTYKATASGSQTDAGSTENMVASYTILDSSGNDVTERFTDVTTQPGTLTVEKLKVEFDLCGFEGEYEDFPLLPDIEMGGIQGTYKSSGDPVDRLGNEITMDAEEMPEALEATFDLTGGGRAVIRYDAMTDAGTYTISPTVTFNAGDENNYEFSYVNNVVKINPMKIIFTLHWPPDEIVYSVPTLTTPTEITGVWNYASTYMWGIPRNSSTTTGTGYSASFSPVGAEITLYCAGFSDAGTHDFTPTCTFNSGNPSNYIISYENTSVTISVTGLSPAEPDGDMPVTGNNADETAGESEDADTQDAADEDSEEDTGSENTDEGSAEESDSENTDEETAEESDSENTDEGSAEDADSESTDAEPAEDADGENTDEGSAEDADSENTGEESAEEADNENTDAESSEEADSEGTGNASTGAGTEEGTENATINADAPEYTGNANANAESEVYEGSYTEKPVRKWNFPFFFINW